MQDEMPSVSLSPEVMRLASQLENAAQVSANEEMKQGKEELNEANEKLSLLQQKLRKFKPLIDLVESHEEESEEVTIVYTEDDQVRLQSLEAIADYLGTNMNVGSLHNKTRIEKIRVVAKYAMILLVEEAYFREMFYGHVSERPILT